MKMTLVLGLLLMIGMVLAGNNNATAPDGFVSGDIDPVYSDISSIICTEDDNTEGEYTFERSTIPITPGTDAFSFVEVNWSFLGSWLGAGNSLRGLDICIYRSTERVMSPRDSLYFVNLDDGTKVDAIRLDPANSNAYGCYPYGSINVSDWGNSNIFHSSDLGANWTPYANPTGTNGRGMDVDNAASLVWETYSAGSVYSFYHLSPTGTSYDVSDVISDHMSGLAVYENGGNHFLVINTYNSNCAYLFDLNNNLNYLGTAAYPYASTFNKSYGLTYSNTRDTFFWSFKNSSNNCYLIELQLDITNLEQSTWGEIKSSF